MSVQLNTVACATYPDKFIRDDVVATFLQLSVVIVSQIVEHGCFAYADLHVGNYILQNVSRCDDLCSEHRNCCDEVATCGCGTHTGYYECICPAGYYGSGLRHECFGTYTTVVMATQSARIPKC